MTAGICGCPIFRREGNAFDDHPGLDRGLQGQSCRCGEPRQAGNLGADVLYGRRSHPPWVGRPVDIEPLPDLPYRDRAALLIVLGLVVLQFVVARWITGVPSVSVVTRPKGAEDPESGSAVAFNWTGSPELRQLAC